MLSRYEIQSTGLFYYTVFYSSTEVILDLGSWIQIPIEYRVHCEVFYDISKNPGLYFFAIPVVSGCIIQRIPDTVVSIVWQKETVKVKYSAL